MIHCFSLNGYNICTDVNSGAVHLLDDATYLIIKTIDTEKIDFNENTLQILFNNKKLETLTKSQIKESYEELFELYNNNLLYSDDLYLDFVDKVPLSPIKSMCLNVAHDCNLRCEYCFASTGDFGEGRKLLSFETGKKAIDFLIKNSANRHNLELDFFGGEPLMNFKVVKQIVEYAREQEKIYNKNFRFTLTTNGLLLNEEIIEYLNKEMSNV
ncbi:MAG: 4Fe-4S cluster-binding domain-containing protein, partial [Clostridia bacterium]